MSSLFGGVGRGGGEGGDMGTFAEGSLLHHMQMQAPGLFDVLHTPEGPSTWVPS